MECTIAKEYDGIKTLKCVPRLMDIATPATLCLLHTTCIASYIENY